MSWSSSWEASEGHVTLTEALPQGHTGGTDQTTLDRQEEPRQGGNSETWLPAHCRGLSRKRIVPQGTQQGRLGAASGVRPPQGGRRRCPHTWSSLPMRVTQFVSPGNLQRFPGRTPGDVGQLSAPLEGTEPSLHNRSIVCVSDGELDK